MVTAFAAPVAATRRLSAAARFFPAVTTPIAAVHVPLETSAPALSRVVLPLAQEVAGLTFTTPVRPVLPAKKSR